MQENVELLQDNLFEGILQCLERKWPFIFHRDSATAHKAIFTNTSLGIHKTQKLSESDA